MKRWLAALLCLLLLFGCASHPAEETAEPPATETTAAVTVATASPPEPTTVPEETTVPPTLPEPEDTDFVRVLDYIPDLFVELKYATGDNFTGQVIYEFSDAYLRYGTVKKLMQVQSDLRQQGLSLKIWDAFRPPAAQFKLWEIYPDGNFVSNPHKGFSSHSKGNTLDVTLTDSLGQELEMPTAFDDFSALADRDYSDCPQTARENALLLENLMKKHGFRGYTKEWWHFTDTTAYEPEEAFVPSY